jgi:hypothetical protein
MGKRFFALFMTAVLVTLVLPSAVLADEAAFGVLAGKPGPSVTVTTQKNHQGDILISVTDFNAFANLSRGAHTETTKWFSPDGGTYQVFTTDFTVDRTGTFNDSHTILWAGTWAETMPGTWTVRVYLDGSATPLGSTTVVLP